VLPGAAAQKSLARYFINAATAVVGGAAVTAMKGRSVRAVRRVF